ncbi:glycosyltransferase [Desulfonatronovibrio hydrogenovorans]|uniref:glycosyltransferase n=1 Tax=Desulfonatronovibrio hydrogenovorans TaxID=53245 RepID=UPI00068F5B5C|nr:glycosyltransferase [Desulfonatronovibrio hydrogenovorans]
MQRTQAVQPQPGDTQANRFPQKSHNHLLNSKYPLSDPAEIFRKKVREGNILFPFNLIQAEMLLKDYRPEQGIDPVLMGTYCLEKAHDQKPYDNKVMESLLHLKKMSGHKRGLPELRESLAYVKHTSAENSRLKIGINYLKKGNIDKANKYLQQDSRISNLEILFSLADAYIDLGKTADALQLLQACTDLYKKCRPVHAHVVKKLASLLMMEGQHDQAADCLIKLPQETFSPLRFIYLGECLLHMGNKSEAMEMWRKALILDPLQIPLYLKLYDLLAENNKIKAHDLGSTRVNILIYSYNKRDALQKTLESLAQTDIGSARILILDNNCTDGTKEMLENIPKLFPNNQVRIITLPVNIGAPAARNWLMSQPENEDTDFIAFLDDDVLLPSDWLKKLIGTLNHFPKAAIAGTKVINEGHPKTIQYIYRFLDVVEESKIILTSKHPDQPDLGQFDLTRKCLSVMGCCHLLRTQTAKEVGEFDIRFSPSQVDDIDHDFMTCLKGHEIVYNGHIEVVHCQKAGKEAFMSRPALGNVMGNDYKLAMKHPTEDMLRLKAETEKQDREFIRSRIQEMRKTGLLNEVPEVMFDVV